MKNIRHPRAYKRPHGKCGLSLLEISIVVAIAGMVVAAIWAAVASVSEKNKINRAMQELQTVSQNMITLYRNRALPVACTTTGASPVLTSNAIDAGVIPGSMVGPTVNAGCKTAVNPWDSSGTGGFILYGTIAAFGMPANSFAISFFNLPQDACVALLTQATSCDPNQPGCPIIIATAAGAAASQRVPAGAPLSWAGVITPGLANGPTLCGANSYVGGINTVNFAFQL